MYLSENCLVNISVPNRILSQNPKLHSQNDQSGCGLLTIDC